MSNFIPVNEPLLNGNEKKYLNECIDTGWISSEGPFIKKFEELLAQRVDRKYGIAVCNGSVALDAAVVALGIGKGDEVILPAFTIISCAAAIVRTGAIPVLVDADPLTWNIDVNQIEARITARTKAIMVVHIYGLPTDMAPILEIARKHDLKIIEDAAEMHGQTYNNIPCGSFGDVSTFSFYPNKHITTGEGGMILTNDAEIAEKCRSLRNLCFKPEKRFLHDELGFNFRMTNLQAALGVAQLERLDEFVERKRGMGQKYNELLSGIHSIQKPLVQTAYAQNIYWVYGVVLKDEVPFNAETAMKKLGELGVGTRPFFYPMHLQPVFRKMGLFINESYPVAERIAERGFYLPSGMALTDGQMNKVVENLKKNRRMSVFNYYARYYDLLYKDKDYQSEAKYIGSLISKNNPQAKSILNLGCGTGKHDLLLAQLGYNITGVDMSQTMIEQAIKNKADFPSSPGSSSFVQGDIREVRLDNKFDIVVSLFHVMSYQIFNQDLVSAIETAKYHLKPGGLFIFDAWYGPAVLTDKPVVRVKRLKDEQLEVTRIAEPVVHSNENIVDVNYSLTIKDKHENTYHELKETHRMRYLFKPEIEFFLNKSDFSLIGFEEWMSGKSPDYSWNVCFVCKSIN